MPQPEFQHYAAAPRPAAEPGPRKRRGPSLTRRMIRNLLFISFRLAAAVLAALAAWCVIVLGMVLWFAPTQYFGWAWAALMAVPGMALGFWAADAAGAVFSVVRRTGDWTLERLCADR